jgi:hypothetical protein
VSDVVVGVVSGVCMCVWARKQNRDRVSLRDGFRCDRYVAESAWYVQPHSQHNTASLEYSAMHALTSDLEGPVS